MKEQLYRVASSRSFTRFLAIAAIAVVAFAALELVFVQQALAGVWCCNSTRCVCDASLACPSTFPSNTFKTCSVTGATADKGTINSEISCIGVSGANNWDSTSVSRTGIQYCEVTGSLANPPHNGKAFCEHSLSYSRPAGLLTPCTEDPPSSGTFTRSHVAFCGQVGSGPAANRLTVTGFLKCNSPDVQGLNSNPPPGMPVDLDVNNLPTVCGGNTGCTLNEGIAGQGGQCSTLFPFVDGADLDPPGPDDLAAGQVLLLRQTFANPSCADPPTNVSELRTRYCSGASFNADLPVDCTFGKVDATILGTTDNALPVDVKFTPPNSLNVGCATGGNQSADIWDFTIFGNAQLNVALIAELQIEGVATSTLIPTPSGPITCSPNGNNNLLCEVKACPDLAQALRDARDPDTLQVDITVTGALLSGTPIIGQQHVQTHGGLEE